MTKVEAVADAGFDLERVIDVHEPWMFHVPEWADRVRELRHTDSALRPLTDDEIDERERAALAAVCATTLPH